MTRMKSIANYIIWSCLIVLVLAEDDECPPDVLIAPYCRCDKTNVGQTVVCSNINDVSILEAMFEKTGDWTIKHLVLTSSILMYIPASAVVEKDFLTLTVISSTLTSLFDAAPTVDSNLTRIELNNVNFQRGIQWDLMTHLEKLIDITIYYSEFRTLGKSFTDSVPGNLRQLWADGTKTSTLDDHVFARQTALNYIQFSNNRISTLKRSMFPNPSQYLNTINFSDNLIETLPDDMFHGMPNLYMISLDGNRLTSLSESVFGGLPEDIVIIALLQNPITCDCSIRWFVNDNRNLHVLGSCARPEDKKGVDVTELQPEWFNYCQRSNVLLDAIE